MTVESSFEDMEAVRAAHAALFENEKTRGDSAVADAVLPFIAKNFCESFVTAEDAKAAKHALQYWDEDARRWHPDGGEEFIKPVIEKVLRTLFVDFEMRE
eukprot:11290874-Alexandrium_andersonii.AAC.1